jgi:hypothetical protein
MTIRSLEFNSTVPLLRGTVINGNTCRHSVPTERNVEIPLTLVDESCNNYYIMTKRKEQPTMTDLLRQSIADSGMSFIGIERETGILRQSLMKFVRSEQSLRLDLADKLAAYFGIECRPTRRKGR